MDLIYRVDPTPLPGILTGIKARGRRYTIHGSESGGLSHHSLCWGPRNTIVKPHQHRWGLTLDKYSLCLSHL